METGWKVHAVLGCCDQSLRAREENELWRNTQCARPFKAAGAVATAHVCSPRDETIYDFSSRGFLGCVCTFCRAATAAAASSLFVGCWLCRYIILSRMRSEPVIVYVCKSSLLGIDCAPASFLPGVRADGRV